MNNKYRHYLVYFIHYFGHKYLGSLIISKVLALVEGEMGCACRGARIGVSGCILNPTEPA
jgi:hypothetical protein